VTARRPADCVADPAGLDEEGAVLGEGGAVDVGVVLWELVDLGVGVGFGVGWDIDVGGGVGVGIG